MQLTHGQELEVTVGFVAYEFNPPQTVAESIERTDHEGDSIKIELSPGEFRQARLVRIRHDSYGLPSGLEVDIEDGSRFLRAHLTPSGVVHDPDLTWTLKVL